MATKTTQIHIRVSPPELKKLRKIAKREKLSMSEWLRKTIGRAA